MVVNISLVVIFLNEKANEMCAKNQNVCILLHCFFYDLSCKKQTSQQFRILLFFVCVFGKTNCDFVIIGRWVDFIFVVCVKNIKKLLMEK